jgi:hypothetical protein
VGETFETKDSAANRRAAQRGGELLALYAAKVLKGSAK